MCAARADSCVCDGQNDIGCGIFQLYVLMSSSTGDSLQSEMRIE